MPLALHTSRAFTTVQWVAVAIHPILQTKLTLREMKPQASLVMADPKFTTVVLAFSFHYITKAGKDKA